MTVEVFILNDDAAAHRLFTHLKAHRRRAAQAGTPLQVTVAPYHGTRTSEQNQTMWGILKAMAEQVYTQDGQLHSEQTWNRYAKERLLPERCARGIDKWRIDPETGERELVMSTSDLNQIEMETYNQQLRAEATAELGVELRSNRA